MQLTDNISVLKGVGPETAQRFMAIGIQTIADLIDTYPRRYEDYSHVSPISALKPGDVTILAVIKQASGRYVRRGMHITEAVASDDSGSVRLAWFNQPYIAGQLKAGAQYYISGQFGLKRQRLVITSPRIELASDFPVHTARIVPVYREPKGVRSSQVRKLLGQVVPLMRQLPETLPDWVCTSVQLPSYAWAIEMMHFPESSEALALARRRLGFEEVFCLSLASLYNKYEFRHETAVHVPFDAALAQQFTGSLPFALTDAQRKVIWQIYQDMARITPMNRLVEGDVGSGKTVVATMAAIMAMAAGFQVAMMAPTELLARQHAETVSDMLRPLGLDTTVCLLVGSMTTMQKKQAHEAIRTGKAQCLIGTNALIQDTVDMHRLGLVIIDEQHRFGVAQRTELQAKAGHMPHVLSMTATPIPRSLALTLYGELDISIVDAKPIGRLPIITRICSPNSRDTLYAEIKQELERGRQMFVVCPLVSDSAALEAKSVETVAHELAGPFKDWRRGVLHGQCKPAEKEAVMAAFARGDIDILIATTVIEVGVNVPNATIMLVENAERFGLAQIHQLRGRVGRSTEQGYCYLMMSDSKAPSPRLRALESSTDGFRLAELDLELRGPGAIYGTMQHGALDLRVAQLSDTKLIAAARSAAQAFIDANEPLVDYTTLHARVTRLRAITNLQ